MRKFIRVLFSGEFALDSGQAYVVWWGVTSLGCALIRVPLIDSLVIVQAYPGLIIMFKRLFS